MAGAEGQDSIDPHAPRGAAGGIIQTVADLMQLVRLIEGGIDVDGDGYRDLDPSQITYYGHSFGALYGVPLHALTPALRASVFLAIGSPFFEFRRLAPANRPNIGRLLEARTPSLLNSDFGLTSIGGVPLAAGPTFNENLPPYDAPAVVNTVAGALDIQQFLDRSNWLGQTADPAAFAPLLRRAPPAGIEPRPFLIQIATADQTVSVVTARNILRAGVLSDRVALYRHDLFWPTTPTVVKNSHAFPVALGPLALAWRPIVVGAQEQFAEFIASGGGVTPGPAPAAFWEFPLIRPLPTTVDYIP
jgi:hypothetical protein